MARAFWYLLMLELVIWDRILSARALSLSLVEVLLVPPVWEPVLFPGFLVWMGVSLGLGTVGEGEGSSSLSVTVTVMVMEVSLPRVSVAV